ncbi:hypothetical protein ILUMI_03548 [Ignelater luminosus]|uniref:Uncharacterized protein n=1 Tax=Ignelater luminosus TaxID=2038154 RepID=A0A8K0GM30_IGNLU|nr:hypothetical protein ILUMI_03548 [Ignelater luminosus]
MTVFGVVSEDRKVCKSLQSGGAVKQSVRDHINAFDYIESHFWIATEGMYHSISTEEFNISFFKPKKDICDILHSYENSTTEEKLKLEEDYQLHRANRLTARMAKESDKITAGENLHFLAAAFDI